jgi:hypothetical protein
MTADPGAFDEAAEGAALRLASHAAVAVVGERRLGHLRSALASRDHIGQAKGILMERFKIAEDDAFVLLVAMSHRTHRKLSQSPSSSPPPARSPSWTEPVQAQGAAPRSKFPRL